MNTLDREIVQSNNGLPPAKPIKYSAHGVTGLYVLGQAMERKTVTSCNLRLLRDLSPFIGLLDSHVGDCQRLNPRVNYRKNRSGVWLSNRVITGSKANPQTPNTFLVIYSLSNEPFGEPKNSNADVLSRNLFKVT